MRICVIPDLHNKIDVADYIINEEDAHVDEFVLLGDYFDDYNDTPEDNRETGLFINEFINNDKFKFLIGNHDLHYIINHAPYQCKNSYEDEKFNAINEVVSEDAWEKMVWTHIRDKWLFSHSGIIATDGVFNQEEHDGKLNLEIKMLLKLIFLFHLNLVMVALSGEEIVKMSYLMQKQKISNTIKCMVILYLLNGIALNM